MSTPPRKSGLLAFVKNRMRGRPAEKEKLAKSGAKPAKGGAKSATAPSQSEERYQPEIFFSVPGKTIFEFAHCRPGPHRFFLRSFGDPDAVSEAEVVFLTDQGTPVGSQNLRFRLETNLFPTSGERTLAASAGSALFRLTAPLNIPQACSRVLIEFDDLDASTLIAMSTVRLEHTGPGNIRKNPARTAIVNLLGGHQVKIAFLMPTRGRRDGIVELLFPDSSGDSAAILSIIGRDNAGKRCHRIVDQPVDRGGTPVYCVPRARRIDAPRLQPKYLYAKAQTAYFEATIGLIRPDGSAFFDMNLLRYRLLKARRYHSYGPTSTDIAATSIYRRKAELSNSDLARLAD